MTFQDVVFNRSGIIRLLTALIVTMTTLAAARDIHVSPQGSDANPGTADKPFRTLPKARDAARVEKGDSTVILAGGTYHLTESFELDQRDSGTTYKAATGADVKITGGVEVAVKDLKPVTDAAVLKRLPKQMHGKVVKLELPGKAVGGSETWPLRFRGYAGWPEVYVKGQALRLARWPNTGYATIAKVLDRGSRPRHNENPDRPGRFKFKEANPTTWKSDQPIYLGGYWCFKWYDEFVRVKSIDSAKREIQMAAPHQYGLGGPSKGLYFAINLLEELDQPGEYVYDGKRHRLYLLLPADAKDALHVSMLNKPLVQIKNAKNLSLNGITFENGCGTGIEISKSDSVKLINCTVRQMSGNGVSINDGRECGLDRCHLQIIGKTGVSLNGGDRKTLTPSKHFVTNSRIGHFARLVQTYCPAVSVRGVGQIVSNNHMHDAPHCAILFGGNDHQMTFNHIERVCLDTSDAGAIYCGRDWTMGGNRIHGNFIKELGKAIHHQNWGIYLDDMASGIEVSNNIVVDTDAGFLIGGGRNNVIVDNAIANCAKESIYFDARGVGWAGKSRGWLNKPDGTMWKRLAEVPYKTGIWNKRFPYLAKIEGDAHKEPRHNIVTGNRVFKSRAMRLNALVSKHGTVKENSVKKSPLKVELNGGRLVIGDKSLKLHESMVIGPVNTSLRSKRSQE
jgi:parallel beta-helix repeat protein